MTPIKFTYLTFTFLVSKNTPKEVPFACSQQDITFIFRAKNILLGIVIFLCHDYQCTCAEWTFLLHNNTNRRKQQKVTSSLGTIKAIMAANNDGQQSFIETACSIFAYLTLHILQTKI